MFKDLFSKRRAPDRAAKPNRRAGPESALDSTPPRARRARPSPNSGGRAPTHGAARDEAVWAAIRAAYVSGETAASVAARFGVGVSTMTRRMREQGWRRCDVARAADAALAPPIDPGAYDVKTLADAPRPQPPKGASGPARRDPSTDVGADVLGEIAALVAAPDPDRIFTRVFAAADAALARAADACLRADEPAAQAAIKLAESLAKVATALAQARAKAPPPADNRLAADTGDAAGVLSGVERVLGDLAASRGAQVEDLTEHGHDPRDAWMWDEAEGRWVWDPGSVMGRSAAR